MTRDPPSRAAELVLRTINAGARRLYTHRLPHVIVAELVQPNRSLTPDELAYVTREVWRSDLAARAYRSFLRQDPPGPEQLMESPRVRPTVPLERPELDALVSSEWFGALAQVSRQNTPGGRDEFLEWCLESFTLYAMREWLVALLQSGPDPPPPHARTIARVYAQRAADDDEPLDPAVEEDRAIAAMAEN